MLKFGPFELDVKTGELRKAGAPVNLPPQPFKILVLLANRAGELVTREEIQQQVWGGETFVDFDQGLNFAIKKIRTALGDDAETPRFIETLPRRGYRFIAAIEPPGVEAGAKPSPAGAGQSAPPLTRDAANSPPAPVPKPQLTTGSVTRKTIATLVDAVVEAHDARKRSKQLMALSIAVGSLAVLLLTLFALNVRGWRDRIMHRLRPGRIESLAVLPLDNLSGDKDQEYFADGMTEELITDLAQIRTLRVISRTSIMQYKGAHKRLPEIAKELNVDAVVEGSVQQSGGRVRVRAELIEAGTDRHLWAQSYERDLRDILTLQDDVALDIANEVRAQLTPQENARLATSRPVNPEAHEAYLQGRYYWNQHTDDGVRKSFDYFQESIQKDQNYALAYSGLSDYYGRAFVEGLMSQGEACPKAEHAALKAIQLDDSLAEPHYSLGVNHMFCHWDWPRAEKELTRAIQLNPSFAEAHQDFAFLLVRQGRENDALTQMKQALENDPMSTAFKQGLAWMFSATRQYDQADDEYRKLLSIDPHDVEAHGGLAEGYLRREKFEAAIAEYRKALDASPGDAEMLAGLGSTLARTGKRDEALKLLHRLDDIAMHHSVPATYQASIYASLGEKEQALAWLEKAYNQRERPLLNLKLDPAFDPLRNDARFQNLQRRVGLPM